MVKVKRVDQRRNFLVRNVPPLSRKNQLDGALRKAKKTQVSKSKRNPAAAAEAPAPPPPPPPPPADSSPGTAAETPQIPTSDNRWRSPMKRFSGGGEIKGFVYRKMWEVEFSVLEEHRGRALLRHLGLESFYLEPIPRLDKKVCDEFLTSYNHKTCSGIVRGKVITLDCGAVAMATKLPFGCDSEDAVIEYMESRESCDSELKNCLQNIKERSSRGFSLDQVGHALGENNNAIMKVAFMVMIKLHCRRECHHYAAPDVILALDRSLRWDMQMRWAEYLAQMMIRASKTAKTGCSYQFGEWLTRIIHNGLLAQMEPQMGTGSSSLQNDVEMISESEPVAAEMNVVGNKRGKDKREEGEEVERLQIEVIQLKKKVEEGSALVASLLEALVKKN